MLSTVTVNTILIFILLTSCKKPETTKVNQTPKEEKSKSTEPQFLAVSRNDKNLLKAYQQARQTLSTFIDMTTDKKNEAATNAVKVKVYDIEHSKEMGEDCFVYLWFYDIYKVDDTYMGQLYELPKGGINDMKIYTYINFTEDLIHDWLIIKNGNLWGGYTLRVIRKSKPNLEEKQKYDKYIGITKYEPLQGMENSYLE